MLDTDFAREFSLGRYRVTVVIRPLLNVCVSEWWPRRPKRLGKRQQAEFEQKRNAVLCAYAERLSGKPAKLRDDKYHTPALLIHAYSDGRVETRVETPKDGRYLAKNKGRPIDGHRLELCGAYGHAQKWRVVVVPDWRVLTVNKAAPTPASEPQKEGVSGVSGVSTSQREKTVNLQQGGDSFREANGANPVNPFNPFQPEPPPAGADYEEGAV